MGQNAFTDFRENQKVRDNLEFFQKSQNFHENFA
jgi:hypothetical protein